MVTAAQRILYPYSLEVKEVAWWSVYEIGQRLCDKFDHVPEGEVGTRLPHVFIAGDACHTHSPKAGQGMNVSMQDSFNLGWKLAAALRGQATPELLHLYSAERQAIAKELIDFEREWAKMLSAPLKSSTDLNAEGVDPAEVRRVFCSAPSVHSGNGDPVQTVHPDRRVDPSEPGRGSCRWHAFPYRAGHSPGRRQTSSPGPHG